MAKSAMKCRRIDVKYKGKFDVVIVTMRAHARGSDVQQNKGRLKWRLIRRNEGDVNLIKYKLRYSMYEKDAFTGMVDLANMERNDFGFVNDLQQMCIHERNVLCKFVSESSQLDHCIQIAPWEETLQESWNTDMAMMKKKAAHRIGFDKKFTSDMLLKEDGALTKEIMDDIVFLSDGLMAGFKDHENKRKLRLLRERIFKHKVILKDLCRQEEKMKYIMALKSSIQED